MANIDMDILESEEKLKEVFKFFDEDGNGDISVNELKRIFKDTAERDIVEKIIKEIDSDNNGVVILSRFHLTNSRL